jgi:hypothetical protein
MAKKFVAANGLSSCQEEEVVIDIRPDGKVSCAWLTLEAKEILDSLGKEPERFKEISNYCG